MENTFFEPKDIFISWNHLDLELKNKVVQVIETGLLSDIECKINSTSWVWDSDRHCNGEIKSSCFDSIAGCSVFVVIITENSLISTWVADEIKCALEKLGNSFIVPIHLSGTIPSDENNPFHCAAESSGISRTDGIFDDGNASTLISRVVAAFNESCYWDYMENSFPDILTIDNEINNTEATNASINNIYIERTLKKYNDPNEEEICEDELVALTDPVLVVGEGGSGKSWLIRNMIRGIKDRRADFAPLIFFVPLKNMKVDEGSFEEYLFGLFVVCSSSFGYTLDNFKALLKRKNADNLLYILFDAIDEVLQKDAINQISEKLSVFFKRYKVSVGNTFFTSRNADFGFVGKSVNVVSERIKAFSLEKFDAERRKAAVDKLFLQLRFSGDRDYFFAALDNISEEITSNPFLLTQLVIIYKNEGNVPEALSEIYEKSVNYYLKRGPTGDDFPILSEVLSSCAYDKFFTEAVKNDKFDFDKEFIPQYINSKIKAQGGQEAQYVQEAQKALTYLHSRSIVINNNFTATLIFEFLTSLQLFNLLVKKTPGRNAFGANIKIYSINGETAHAIAKSSSENNKWDNILKIFLSKADNELDEKVISALYECFVGDCDNLMLFFETASNILKKRRDFELIVLSGILLRRTLLKEFGYYDELFFYIPKFRLYNYLARAVLSITDNSLTAFYLLRDMCFIYADKDKITEVDEIGIYANKLSEEFSELKTDSYRYNLCELFYGDDIVAPNVLAEKYKPLYPREFCIIHAANRAAANADKALKKERDLEEAAIDSPVTFVDTEGIYAETDFDSIRFTGLCFLPYDTERINSCVNSKRAKMLSGVILLPTEHTEIEQMRFPKTNLLYYSIPYNTTKLSDYCFNFCRDITYMFIPSFTESISEKSFITVKRLWLYYEYSPRITTITRFLPTQTELYKLTADSISEIGESAFYFCKNLTLTSLPDGVTKIKGDAFKGCKSLTLTSLPEGVTEIDKYAFSSCISLALTSLPIGITKIGESAFSGCESLVLTSLPDGVTEIGESTFEGCTRLALTSLPYGVTEIQTGAFYGCTSLALTSLPDRVTEIGAYAFISCKKLALKSLPDRLTKIGWSAFGDCISLALTSLPTMLTEIGQNAFSGCTSLALTSLPDNITEIESYAFSGCTTLTLTSLPDKLTDIKERAFSGCIRLALTSLPYGVTEIGGGAFEACTSLALAILPEEVTYIRDSTFSGCSNLMLTSLPSKVTEIGQSAFQGCSSLALTSLPVGLTYIDESAFIGCSNRILKLVHEHIERLTKYNTTIIMHSRYTVKKREYFNKSYITDICFPNGLTEIQESAFSDCTNLMLESLPAGVTKIGEHAFSGCKNLALKFLPAGVTMIESSAFSYCRNIVLTGLPYGVTEIKNNAFRACKRLALTSLPTCLTKIGEWAFEGCTSLVLNSLPDGVSEIKRGAFSRCTSLALTSLPGGLTRIERNTFEGCQRLVLKSLPDIMTEIGQNAFYGCINLALKSLPDELTKIGSHAFLKCRSLAFATLPAGVTEIKSFTFLGCTSLTLTSLPDRLTKIGWGAFKECTSLALTELPHKLVIIGESAFKGCTGITEMYIPDSVQEIGDGAFIGCSLRRVRIRNEFQPDVRRIFGDAPIVYDFY